jgi:hypothetical protein
MLDGLTSNAVVCPGYFRFGGFSALAAVHGKRRDSLLRELKLTLKIAQRNVILKAPDFARARPNTL